MSKLIDPAAVLSVTDQKNKAKATAERVKAVGWKVPTTKKGKEDEAAARFADWEARR